MSTDEPVVIETFLDIHQAEFALSVLHGNGIEAELYPRFIPTIAPHHMAGGGGVRLLVRSEDALRARDVLDQFDEGASNGSED
jgi:hypothetical protein